MFKKIWYFIQQSAKDSEPQFIPLGIIGAIGFAIYYVIWHDVIQTAYENMPLRLTAIGLCLGLTLKNYWPSQIRFLLPLYWYITITYIMPFFFTFMLLKNNFSNIWVQNSMTALFFMILLLDWVGLFVLLFIGILIALIFYHLTTPYYPIHQNLGGIISAYLAVIGVSTLFVHNKNRIQQDKLQTLKALGGSIAHELRTPLRTISLSLESIKKSLSLINKKFSHLIDSDTNITAIEKKQFLSLPSVLDRTETELQASFTIIDMLLVKLTQLSSKTTASKKLLMSDVINIALKRYPFDSNETSMIKFDKNNDFLFLGDEDLIVHVIFNLLKNALYYIKVAGKGDILIWCETRSRYNELHFKDSGKGIDKKTLPLIFDRYFSKTYHGTGIGLTFCKMVMHGFSGDIICRSKEGEFTEFVLYFPKSLK